jgi:hypothetical protein
MLANKACDGISGNVTPWEKPTMTDRVTERAIYG